ncbi:MAG TPA: hypothetical protein VMW83_17280 [Spirochaetia bacterium]|nr:hypothetical protein [Spirochaetia bacterium]
MRRLGCATTDPATVAVMATVFNADWTDTAAGGRPRAQLVLSPGAEDALLNLIDSAKSGILIETEEFGSVPAIESALAARAPGLPPPDVPALP